jgi:hypothetical protein
VRVAVRHTDPDHPNAHWFAFAEGRILGFVHPGDGESWTPERVAEALLARAKKEFPEAEGYEHRIETLHVVGQDENGNEKSEWRVAGESDAPPVAEGQVVTQELSTEQVQTPAAEAS